MRPVSIQLVGKARAALPLVRSCYFSWFKFAADAGFATCSTMLRSALLASLALALAGPAAGQCPDKDFLKKVDPSARTSLYSGQLAFTLHLFDSINKAIPEDNIFFSPHSVYHALLLAYFSTSGATEKALKQSLEIEDTMDKASLMAAYRSDRAARALNQSASYEFSSVNRLFADAGLGVRDCVRQFFGDELNTLDFRNSPAQSRDFINAWVSMATKKNIEDLLPADAVTAASRLLLANAAYFKGVWAAQFPPERTKKEAFFVSETRQTLVPFMKQKGTFHYMVSEELGAQVLELPYKGNDISMYILLPPYSMKEGVSNIIANLTPARLAAVVEESYMGREVAVEIPKFTIERSLPLRPILEHLGVGDLFDASADFSALTSDAGVRFDDAVHRAKIQLDEEGTTAAAATAIFGFRSSRPAEPTRFVANFPFVYVLYERPTASILFMGVYRDPKK